ncbi:hypothetical protein AGABI2DRAFT_177523 [Agaricus bisporus var. bisporus H97]|uniref:hypothetical protein n=1 Tax=Agaricus bisporus var. bisporus (strain H97 / ATCC MYA-4626 / FGSC 10389) TaxID=936046 RepID=UPI00029F6B41|nr:hypothetical protein AGABI2DRAFT_177523 [Agaricus bisporus var. bisporus H97]EKV49594.1 hypothetical protein AGABI2DRAFT_177523 [Agaricus bisporus var. bisporus H97]
MDAVVEEIARQEGPIMGARYISAVALSCLLYDHFLHFDEELTDIWLALGRRTILKLLFLLGRYCTITSVIYSAISLGSFNTMMGKQVCQIWVIMTAIFSQLSLIGTEAIVIYRLRSLWHFNRPITHAITAMVVVVFITAVVSMSVEAVNLKGLFRPVLGLPGCLFIASSSNHFIYMLVLGLVFVLWDIFNVCIFTFNTFATPYLCSSDLLKRFKHDGGRYFLYLLVVHALFLFTVAFGQNSRFSTIPLIVALTTVINARIFHGIALEVEQYADECEIVLPKVTSR